MITSDHHGKFDGKGWYVTRESGIEVHWLPVLYDNKMSNMQRIRAFLRFAIGAALRAAAIQADVVFATSTPLTIAIPGVYASKRQQIPMVFEVRDLWPEAPIAIGSLKGPMIWPALWLEKFAYRHAERIIALAPRLKQGVIKKGISSQRIHIIPNGSELTLFTVAKSTGTQFRQKFNWLGKRPLVVYTGTIGKVNGLIFLVNLAKAVWGLDQEICFLIVGDGIEKKGIEHAAKKSGVLNNNFFMLHPVPKEQIPSILSAADLATSLTINNPQFTGDSANKIFDAFASKTPVAINHGGWMAKLLKETGAGLVLQPDQIERNACTVVDFLHDKKQLEQAGLAAKQLAETQFNWNNLAKKLERILQNTITPKQK